MRFRKTLIFFILTMGLVFTLPAWAQQKPLTQDQVQSLVRSGLGDETGAKAIEQRGIDFDPAEDLMQNLKTAGANEEFLKALRAAKRPEPASAKKPLDQVQVILLLAGGVPTHRVAMLVKERGIDFEPQDDYLQEVRLGGGGNELISALKSAKVTKPGIVDPAAQARQTKVRQPVARGAELARKGQYARAEQEYRAAMLLDSQNADICVSLAYVLIEQMKWDDAAAVARDAIRLNPNNGAAHRYLGVALREQGSCIRGWLDKAWSEPEKHTPQPEDSVREVPKGIQVESAAESNPDFVSPCGNVDLNKKREASLVAAIAELGEAIRLNRDDDFAHVNLGEALADKGDWDGAIAEYREALRLNPNNDLAHIDLGYALGGGRGDLDGAIAETRLAVQLDSNNPWHHSALARWLEKRGDRHVALAEYRAAYTLAPQNPILRAAYESFLQKTNAAQEKAKLQHWVGTWAFAGPIKWSTHCGSGSLPDSSIPNFSFTVIAVLPSGEVTARVKHPRRADEEGSDFYVTLKPDWSGTATETGLVINLNPIPTGTILFPSSKAFTLKEAAGRLEAHQEGGRYSAEFTYLESFSWPGNPGCETHEQFLGAIMHPQ
jgi:tetratricopeptide (TPR) repeat protein